MDNKTILENLINYYANGNKKRFSEILGIKPQTLSGWLNRGSMDYVLLFTKLEGVSASFLLTGEGEMFEAPSTPTISQTVTASSHVTQTAGAPAETPAAANALLAAKDETIAANALLAAKDETIAALRQSLADKERLICTLLEARSTQNP